MDSGASDDGSTLVITTEMITPSAFPNTCERLRSGELKLDRLEATSVLSASPAVAADIIRLATDAATRPDETVVWGGHVDGPLELDGLLAANLILGGLVDGDFTMVRGSTGSVTIEGWIKGDVDVKGPVARSLIIDGQIDGWCSVTDDGRANELRFGPNAVIGGTVEVTSRTPVFDIIEINQGARVAGWVQLGNNLAANSITISGEIEGSVRILGDVARTVMFTASARPASPVLIDGSVGSDNDQRHGVRIHATFDDLVDFRAPAGKTIRVESLSGATFTAPVRLGDGVDLSHCDFTNFTGFDQLRLHGANQFSFGTRGRQQFDPTIGDPPPTNTERSSIYRNLRRALEQQGDRPAAADFYYGECEARRLAARDQWRQRWSEYLVLSLYKKISGYGTRTLYALGWFLAIAAMASALFAIGGIDVSRTYSGVQTDSFADGSMSDRWAILLFSVRSMVGFLSPPDGNLTLAESALQLALRFLGPILAAQAVLAVRERVAR